MRFLKREILSVLGGAALVLLLFWWWASSGYPTQGQICDPPDSAQNCTNHNVLFSSVRYALYELNFYGVLITAIATALIARFTIVLASVGRRQIDDTRILERAYLSVRPAGIEPFRSADGRLSCDVWFVNSGNLPASKVSWFIDQKFGTDPELNDFPINEKKFAGNNLIPPGGEIRKGSPSINSAELDAFRERQRGIPDSCWLYVWGQVRYLDGFNNKRWIDFCYRYYLAGTTWTISSRHGRQHEYGNRTDEG
jgi:hypothetical protein